MSDEVRAQRSLQGPVVFPAILWVLQLVVDDKMVQLGLRRREVRESKKKKRGRGDKDRRKMQREQRR